MQLHLAPRLWGLRAMMFEKAVHFRFIEHSDIITTRLTEHNDAITPLLRGAPRLGFALDRAFSKAGPGQHHLETRPANLWDLSKAINKTLLVFGNFFTVNSHHTQTGQLSRPVC